MLILQRKEGESLLIGDEIEVTVLAVEAGRARLAIQAPPGRHHPAQRTEGGRPDKPGSGGRGSLPPGAAGGAQGKKAVRGKNPEIGCLFRAFLPFTRESAPLC